jgi:Domain of unknown function (DUF4177)
MKPAFLITFASGLVLGVLGILLTAMPGTEVQAQEKAKQWEYKVVRFHSDNGEAKDAEQLNKLGQDGWEFVGVLCTVTSPQAGLNEIAFRRLKR